MRAPLSKHCVAYLGTFTNVLMQEIQIGFMIVTGPLAAAATVAQRLVARPAEVAQQAVLATFMRRGGLSRHLRRLRRIHLARRDALVAALRRELARMFSSVRCAPGYKPTCAGPITRLLRRYSTVFEQPE